MSRDLDIQSLSAIEHMLTHCPERVHQVWLYSDSPRTRNLERLARQAQIPVEFTREKRESDEPVRARVLPFEYTELKDLIGELAGEKRSLLLALDHLQDPQNFGAICRTAEGLGVGAILLPKDRSVAVTPGVYHASVGAVETIPVVAISNLGEALRKLKDAGYWIVGTTLGEGSTDLAAMPDFEKIVLVMGAEWEGLSTGIEKLCDWKLHIPLAGKVQSLNVSAAGAILMYALRQRANSLAVGAPNQ